MHGKIVIFKNRWHQNMSNSKAASPGDQLHHLNSFLTKIRGMNMSGKDK